MTDTSTPRIYVASLADYNAGTLHGKWIDADQDADALLEEVKEMLAESSEPYAEEWAIHDYEGFGDYRVSEYASLETVSLVAQEISGHGPAFAAWLENDSENVGRLEYFQESYMGEWESVEDYVEETFTSMYDIPKELEYYIDWEKMACDWTRGGDIWTTDAPGGNVYIFRNN